MIPLHRYFITTLRKCSWNKEKKYWFISSDHYDEDENFFETYKRVDLNVPYAFRNEVKNNGAKWDVFS